MSVCHEIKMSVSKCPNDKKADTSVLCILEIHFFNMHGFLTFQTVRDLGDDILNL
jgi:hypothetical protein